MESLKKVYILHGWTYSTTGWDACVAELRKNNIEAVMLNVPGLTEASEEVWNLEKYVDWLSKSLPENESINLIAHSNGGRIAIGFINQFPNRINKLILVDSAGLVRNEFSIKLKKTIFGSIAKIFKPLVRSNLFRKIFYKMIGANDYERAPVNMRETMKNLINIDLKESLKNIAIPTLIIWGKKDMATPVSDAHVMNKEIGDSKLVVIADAGHSPHMSHPENVAGDIVAFI